MRVARRLTIGGHVQGVGFRHFAREAAVREGATGWVRKLQDGRVEAHVEGEAEAVIRLERVLRQGPRGARVEDVDVDADEPSGGYVDFTIR